MVKVYWLFVDGMTDVFKEGYVGITKNIKIRCAEHRKRFWYNFKFQIIFYGSLEQCLALEFQLRPLPGIGWNKAVGGSEGYRLGHSESTIAIIKEKRKNQKPPALGRKQLPEEIEKRRKSQLGQKRSETAITNMRGRKQAPELKEKLRKINTGKKHTPEMKAKVVAALTGRPVSKETKAKMSKANDVTRERKWSNLNLDMTNVIMLK